MPKYNLWPPMGRRKQGRTLASILVDLPANERVPTAAWKPLARMGGASSQLFAHCGGFVKLALVKRVRTQKARTFRGPFADLYNERNLTK